MSTYDATLLEQLEDTEGENEVLSLEVERLTAELERIQEDKEKQQHQVIAQLVELFPKQKDLSPEAYGAWLAKKVRDLQSDASQARRDNQNGYIDIVITQKATQMYRGDENGMPDPSDRMSYDEWMRNGMKVRHDAPMKNVFRTTKDDLVREYFTLCEFVKKFAAHKSFNTATYSSNDGTEMLWQIAEQQRMPLFKSWLGVNSPALKTMYQRKADDNSLYLMCTPAGREDCERVLTVLKRAVAKRKEKKNEQNLKWDDSFYLMTHTPTLKMLKTKRSTPNRNGIIFDNNVEAMEKFFKMLEEDEKAAKELMKP